ncbi:MAG: ABC transporter substrate-binding protein [Eubacteriales bacterium]|nr:ABC transporter substrate-binding protein [Eubacteriales bacterium]
MKKMKKFMSVLLAAGLLSTAFGGGQVSVWASEDSAGGVLKGTCSTTPDTCDPARGSGANDDMLYINVYEALVKPSEEDGSALPWLATEWSYDEETMDYTFKLREDVVFADGTPFTAADVKYTMDRMLTINDGYSYLFTNYVESTEVIDDYTVSFHLTQTYGPFVSALEQCYILNSTLMQENTEESGDYGENGDYGTNYLLDHSAGSGAYEITAFEVNSSYTMTRNSNWWGEAGEKAPSEIQLSQVTDAATTKMLLQGGDVDFIHGYQESATVKSLTAAGYETAALTEFGEDYFMMNVKAAPTDDVHIRRAISYACNYEAMSEMYSGAEIPTGPVPQNLWGYSSDTDTFTYDLEKAAEEIAQSAYADNLADYPVTMSYIQGNGETGKLTMLLAETMQQLGFTVNIQETPWVSFCDAETDVSTSPNITNCFVSASYPEAGSLLESKYASWTLGNYNQNEWLQDDTLDSMIEEALATVDDTEREAKYAEIQKYVVNEVVPSVYVLVSTVNPVWNKDSFEWCVSEGEIRPVISWNYYFNDFTMAS